jgi:hypothetical protein
MTLQHGDTAIKTAGVYTWTPILQRSTTGLATLLLFTLEGYRQRLRFHKFAASSLTSGRFADGLSQDYLFENHLQKPAAISTRTQFTSGMDLSCPVRAS